MFFGRPIRKWGEAAAGLLYPPHCAACGCALSRLGGGLCRDCRRACPKIEGACCLVCGQPYSGALSTDFRCRNCGDQDWAFAFATAAYRSRGVVRHLIHQFKYGGHLHLRHLLARMLSEGFRDRRVQEMRLDGIVPVPLHPTRRREREFNQADVLAQLAGARLGLPVLDCLRRKRYTQTQTHFHRAERIKNLSGAFSLTGHPEVEGQRLALVDDVLTTGSTADACASVLRQAGVAVVVVITVSRG